MNKSAELYKSSAENISLLLQNAMINPWKISEKAIQLIEESGVNYEFDGVKKENRLNILGILVFSIVFGVFLSKMGEQGKLMTQWFSIMLEITMKIVELIMW